MTPDEAAKLIEGKTIKKIHHYPFELGPHVKWSMCVSKIDFIDGTVLELGGNADEAFFERIILPDKEEKIII